MQLAGSTNIRQKDGYVTSEMDGELVMLSVENGKYYNLGIVGGQIWQLAQGQGMTVAEIVARLVSEYEVTESQCEQEVAAFVEQMEKAGIIAVER
ncbi:lasso peptide biosynthesis PqqD family chaperone [Cohnella faecalis]|nr:lasso peptide biosynthesis PqqD family chaperone [Cohnella faecalis]